MTQGVPSGPRLVAGQIDGRSASAGGTSEPGERHPAAAVALLQFQADMRRAKTVAELSYFGANETRSVMRAQQVIVFSPGIRSDLHVSAVSSITTLERTSPLILWFESLVKWLSGTGGLSKVREFDASAHSDGFEDVQRAYPLGQMLWVPWSSPTGDVVGGMLLCRATPWSEQETKVAAYVGAALGHACEALGKRMRGNLLARLIDRRIAAATAVILAGLLAIPVPMTALAPVEVAPRETFIVTPGVEGVVRSVEVEPNAIVRRGQVLVTLVDTVLRNRAEIAQREVLVADTKYKKSAQLAFVDARGRHEMAIARSELDLKLAERDYARELLLRTEIKAERDGVAFFADKKDLVGKPVVFGEKLMEVADPASGEFRIDLPAADAIVLRTGARVKVFLDSDPLNPVEATLVRASYKAALREAQQFAFRVIAVAALPQPNLRLGMRGTAQLYSDQVMLGFYLFRRPIAAVRQWTGL